MTAFLTKMVKQKGQKMNLQNVHPDQSIVDELSEKIHLDAPETFKLDEKGFVFLDGHNRPYLARMYHSVPWLFYWHVENHWVTLRRLTQADLWTLPHNLIQKQQDIYHRLNLNWMQGSHMANKHEPQFCDGPSCDNDVGLFLLAGVAVTGDALGDKAFCCDCCAEEWLDWMQDRAESSTLVEKERQNA